jgi:hypothetical protein
MGLPSSFLKQPTAGQLPQGFCPRNYQELFDAFVANLMLETAASTNIIFAATKPADTTLGWGQLDNLGRLQRIYYFAQGAWLAKHTSEPGTTIIWTSSLPDFTAFDGGDANPLSAISGPMWEEVVALRAKLPIGVGTLPSGKVLAIGDTGGAEPITVDQQRALLDHTHCFGLHGSLSDGRSAANFRIADVRTKLLDTDNSRLLRTDEHTSSTEALSASIASAQAYLGTAGAEWITQAGGPTFDLPPYLAVYFLRRTGRTHYAIF